MLDYTISIVPLSQLQRSSHGKVLLTASGPLVNTLCFEQLPAMPAVGVNGAYFLHHKVDFTFYVIVNMGFIDRRPDVVLEVIKQRGLTLFTTVHGMARILGRFTLSALRCRLAIIEDIAERSIAPASHLASLGRTMGRTAAYNFPTVSRALGSARISAVVSSTRAPSSIGRCRSSPTLVLIRSSSPDWI